MAEPETRTTQRRWLPVPALWLEAQCRERDVVRAELYKIRGLFPLLMKTRNGGRWTANERLELMTHIRSLGTISPYLVVLALPGSFIALPALAWWLDRRRHQRNDATPRP